MKLNVQHPQGENSAFSLIIEYCVPVGDMPCMSFYSDREKALSLHRLFEFDGDVFSMPSTLTFEVGDKILLFDNREIIVREQFSLSVRLDFHEHFVSEIVSYFVMGTYLHYQPKDPDFFTAFNRIFTIQETTPFTKQEIEQNILADEEYGDNIEDYFTIPPETRQTFLTSTKT